MNRTYSLLVAGLLGTGCVSSDVCDAHTVWVAWPDFVRTVAGGGYQTTASCAGIDHLEVFVDNSTSPYTAFCNDNDVPVQLQTGNHTLTVEAIDAAGFPILRDVVDTSISDTCVDQTVDTQPGEGWVTVNYDFGGGAGCVAGSYIWFNITDQIAGIPIAGVNRNSSAPEQYACNAASLQPPFSLPAGNYTIDWMEEVYFSGGDHASARYCSPVSFAVNSGRSTSTPVVPLADTTAFCPQSP